MQQIDQAERTSRMVYLCHIQHANRVRQNEENESVLKKNTIQGERKQYAIRIDRINIRNFWNAIIKNDITTRMHVEFELSLCSYLHLLCAANRILCDERRAVFKPEEDGGVEMQHVVEEPPLAALVAQIRDGRGHHYDVVAAAVSLEVFVCHLFGDVR
jgi:hypothetical protein